MKKTLALLMSVIVSGAIFIQCKQAAVSTSSNIAEISSEENNISKAQQAAEEFVKEYFTYNPNTIGEVLDKASSYFLNPKDILDGKDFQVKIIKSKNEVSTYILSTLGSKIEENIKIDNKEYKSYVLNFKIDYILDGKPIYKEIKLRMVNKDETTSDLSTKAALNAIKCANLKPQDIDLIIVATATPDMVFPSTACLVQENIGAINAAAFDISVACSGFIYAMTIAKQFVENKTYKKVLVIGAETLSKVLDYEDRTTAILFGDGAGAVVIGEVLEGGILSTYLGSDGKGKDFLNIPAGGSKLPASKETVENRLHTIKMAGNDVYKFAVRIMSEASLKALEMADLNTDSIDYLIPHQANIRIIEASAKRLKLNMDKVYVNLDKYGNMSAASIPVALDEAFRKGKIHKGDNVVLVGFGGGLTWGSSVINWSIQGGNNE
ncbi:hypothetical protein SDC9_84263 [bioreactor metagenome]|uniref:Beta-ketoacyl-[acyl-carrier-protein] synthase III n=1 Tax=bioreactor metagenome TaxID=1076179 RepID=A0A644Z9R9_9ZZZZ